MRTGLNVILPCAGEGSRLGLPYPKEIHTVDRGMALIDHSFGLLLPHAHLIDRVTITLTKHKAEVLKYLDKYKGSLDLCFTFFNEAHSEWAGSILSADHLFLERNVVLLPDSVITERPGLPVIPTMDRLLAERDVVFAYKEECGERLRALGALSVGPGDGSIRRFCDKPVGDLEGLNAYWTAFGFRGAIGSGLLHLMTRSIRKEPVDLAGIGSLAGFPVDGYRDLGTWEALKAFRAGDGG